MVSYNDLTEKHKDLLFQTVLFLALSEGIANPEQYVINWLSKKQWKSKRKARNWVYWKMVKIEKIQESFKK